MVPPAEAATPQSAAMTPQFAAAPTVRAHLVLLRDDGSDGGMLALEDGAVAWVDCWFTTTSALTVTGLGVVDTAARAVGMGRASAYRLRERAGAAGFAEAWDIAIACGADLQFHTALDQAINGVTTVRVMRGGMVEVVNAPDRKVLNAALLPKTRLSAALSAQARAVKATRET